MLHKHGGDIYAGRVQTDFSANINFRGMPASVQAAAERAVSASVHYPDPECRTLRAALAKRENTLLVQTEPEKRLRPENEDAAGRPAAGSSEPAKPQNIMSTQITAEQIICGNGAAELMFALAAARKPRRALLAVPSFFEYEQALTAFDCETEHFVLRKEQDFALDDAFQAALQGESGAACDIVVLGNPNNPNGRLIDAALLEKLICLCREREILLVLDESFFDFLDAEAAKRTFSGVREVQSCPQIFVMKSFTKMYGMPGLRFGYGICSDRGLLERMREVLQPWNVSVPAQAAGCAAAGELEFARTTARQISANRGQLRQWMEEAGYRVFHSDANFLLFEGPESLQEYCRSRGFLIRDCSNYPGLQKGFFRVCVRGEEENAALMQVLRDARKSLQEII